MKRTQNSSFTMSIAGTMVSVVSDNSRGLFYFGTHNRKVWTLLLTWFYFNPSMDI